MTEQEIRDQALRDAAALIRSEWVCCSPDNLEHTHCKYSEYAARNAERLIGTPVGFHVGAIYDWEASK